MRATRTRGERRPIRVLDAEVTNQIAAGEVIERPASVVKELVENSVDAGARQVRIEVRGGGKELIRVSDDGVGLDPEEAPLAFERHATSKIRAATDLISVRTLGFRGEALPSIASVSRVTLISRPPGEELGVRVEASRGEVRTAPAGAPFGTQVEVRDLFFNTPARFKFLKSDATERRYIAEYVTHTALAHPDVAFRLIMEGSEVLRTPGDGRLKEAIAAVYGRRVERELLAVEWESPWARITGYVGKPSVAKGNRSAESVFVNGRWVRNRLLATAVERGFESLLAHRRFPLAVLHLEIDPSLIDVNVHPAKTEVRFKGERETFKAVMLAVRKALVGADLTASFAPRGSASPAPPDAESLVQSRIEWAKERLPIPQATSFSVGEAEPVWRVDGAGAPPAASKPAEPADALREAPADEGEEADGGASLHAELPLAEAAAAHALERAQREAEERGLDPRRLLLEAEVLGQLAATYLLVPTPLGLWLVDQHVAHERILYERFLKRDGKPRATQELLVPHPLELTPLQGRVLEEHKEELEALGFAVEAFGGSDYILRGVPADLGSRGSRALLQLIEELLSVFEQAGPTRAEKAAATMACRGAVKAGDRLHPEEMKALLRELAHTENPFACPHGRPVIVQLTLGEIERRFGRS